MENQKLIFCANCQTPTPHSGSIDSNGEIVATCTNEGCGRFIKLPADTTPEQFDAYIQAHQQANIGQVSVAEQQKKLDALFGAQPGQAEQPVEQPAPPVLPDGGQPVEQQAPVDQPAAQPAPVAPEAQIQL